MKKIFSDCKMLRDEERLIDRKNFCERKILGLGR